MENSRKPYPITDEVWMVPCKISGNNKSYKPVCRPITESKSQIKLLKQRAWTKEEDEILDEIVVRKNSKIWSSIAKEINNRLYKGLEIRNGKKCRERWANHLDPKLNKDKWSKEEDQIIVQQQQIIGKRWSEIAKHLNGRTENQVKNRFKSLQCRAEKVCPDGFETKDYILAMVNPEMKINNLVIPNFLEH